LTLVLIPLEARIRRESPQQLAGFRAQLLGATVILGVVIAGIARLVMPVVLTSPAVGLPANTVGFALQALPFLCWFALPGVLVSLYSTWMMSNGSNANTLLEGVPALAICLAALVSGGIGSLVWGTVLGVGLQAVCVAWPRVVSGDVRAPAFRGDSPAWQWFTKGFATLLVGQAIFGVTTLVDQFFAAGLGEGAISSLSYAARLVSMVNAVVSIAVTRSTLPAFARVAVDDPRRLRRVALRWASLLLFVGVAVVVIGWPLAPWVVRMLFEHGTFNASDSNSVATLLRFGLLQLPFFFPSLVLVSLHSSRGGYRILALSGLLGLIVKVVSTWLLIKPFGLNALMMSAAITYLANALWLLAVALLRPERAVLYPGGSTEANTTQ